MESILTRHDREVLEKIKDPESAPSNPLLIDHSLPKDPHVTDTSVYQLITQRERSIINSIQQIEFQLFGSETSATPQDISQYSSCVTDLDNLINEYPKYASARNNRAQALRRLYGDLMLVKNPVGKADVPPALDATAIASASASESSIIQASTTVLSDLDTAISLLTPRTPFAALSPQAAKTLSQAYTQRGVLYHLSAKHLSAEANLRINRNRREADWTVVDLEEAASRDFVMGGRYGNEVAKALAVSSNPTAKLCGDMVREAMKREYGGGVGS